MAIKPAICASLQMGGVWCQTSLIYGEQPITHLHKINGKRCHLIALPTIVSGPGVGSHVDTASSKAVNCEFSGMHELEKLFLQSSTCTTFITHNQDSIKASREPSDPFTSSTHVLYGTSSSPQLCCFKWSSAQLEARRPFHSFTALLRCVWDPGLHQWILDCFLGIIFKPTSVLQYFNIIISL